MMYLVSEIFLGNRYILILWFLIGIDGKFLKGKKEILY